MTLPPDFGGVLVCLQSAYQKGRLQQTLDRRTWLDEFLSSRTARRLSEVFGRDALAGLNYTNCTPVVTVTADEVPPASPAHLRRALRRHRPRLVLACGKMAESLCLRLWGGDLLVIPHPASRLLSNRLLHACSQDMRTLLDGRSRRMTDPAGLPDPVERPCRLAFRQLRGEHCRESLPAAGHARGTVWPDFPVLTSPGNAV